MPCALVRVELHIYKVYHSVSVMPNEWDKIDFVIYTPKIEYIYICAFCSE